MTTPYADEDHVIEFFPADSCTCCLHAREMNLDSLVGKEVMITAQWLSFLNILNGFSVSLKSPESCQDEVTDLPACEIVLYVLILL